jgi:hypothetical protein
MKAVQNKISFPKTTLPRPKFRNFSAQTSKFGGWLCKRNAYIKVLDPGDAYLNAVMRFSHLRDRARANLEAALVTAADSLFPPTPNTATEAEEAEEVPDPQTRRDASPQETEEATNAEARLLAMGSAGSAGSAAEPTEGGAGSAAEPTEAGAEPRLTSGQAARILRERCPACFGL